MNRYLPPLSLLLLLGAMIALAALAWGAQGSAVRRSTPAAGNAAVATQTAGIRAPAVTPAGSRKASHRRATVRRNDPAVTPGSAGLKAYIDPETGQIGGMNAASPVINDIDPLNDSDAGLVEQRMPDGHYMVDLKGRFADYMMVEIDPSGKRIVRCVRNRGELATPQAPAPAAKPEER